MVSPDGRFDEDPSCVVARLPPVGSSHDRAVELFYYLKGGTVDYGRAHSQKYCHKRYGRTYATGALSRWDAEHPIIIVGHSHGGNTARMLQRLLHEQFFSDHKETSAEWVSAIVCVASPLNGCPLMHSLGVPMRSSCSGGQALGPAYSLVRLGQTLGYVAYWLIEDAIFDWGLRMWPGLTRRNGGWSALMYFITSEHPIMNTDDMAAYELTPEGAAKLNESMPLHACTRYFTIPCTFGTLIKEDLFVPFPTVAVWMLPIALLDTTLSTFSNGALSSAPSDGCSPRLSDLLVPTYSQNFPLGQRNRRFDTKEGGVPRAGVWNTYPTVTSDHFSSSYISEGSIAYAVSDVLEALERQHGDLGVSNR
eukprot:g126.t1